MIVLVVTMGLLAVQAVAASNPRLDASLLSYTPVPAEPGSFITVTIKIENEGDASTPNAAVEFVDNYPFTVQNEKLKRIGSLNAQGYYLAEYRVRIDSQAAEGTNILKIRYTPNMEDQNTWVRKDIELSINSVQKTISINDIVITPEVISPGGQAKAEFKVKNIGTSNLREVSLKLNLEGILIGSTYVDIPLAPIGSSVEKQIALLESGQTADFEFVLQAYPDAEAGIYKIPITLTYTDDAGTEYTRTDLYGMVINGDVDILIQVDSTTLYTCNGKGDVTISATNKGFSEIKFATILLEDTDDYDIKSLSNEVYVGNIDSDDYETAEFTVKMEKQGLDEVTLPVTLTFKDALNKEHVVHKDISLELVSATEAGHKDSKAGLVIVIIAAVAVIGFLLYRRSKSRKRRT